MESLFSDRIQDVPRSFIREILKVTMDKQTSSTFRLNFSCVDEPIINDGIKRLAEAIRSLQRDQR